MSEERNFINEEYKGNPSATKRRLERLADADDPEVELVKMEKDRMRQQLNRALKRAEGADPADDADASTAASDPMDPARLEEAALAQASTYGGSEHKKAARMARLAESANPELELIRMEKSRLNGARRRVKQKAEIASARKELEELEKAGTEVEVVLPEGEAKEEEIKEEGEGGAEEAGNFEYRGSERNKLHRMARLRASGDPEKTLRTLELNRLRCKKIRERKKALKEAAENPLGAPPEGVSAKELRHMTCPVCGKIFSSKAAARAHVQYVHMKKGQRETTVCHLCGKAASARYIKKHIEIAHGEGKKYVCDICGYSVSNKTYMNTHKQRMHGAGDPRRERKRFECRYCDYHHWMKVVRDEHEKGQHLKLKDQECPQCEFKTSYRGQLNSHILRQHLSTGMPKDFKCTEPGCLYKGVSTNHVLSHLKKVHKKGRDCPHCEFVSKVGLPIMEHMKEFHPDAERFNCPTCGYLAISRSNLDYHIQCVHESGTQRNCTMCEFSADNNRNLVKHFKEVHDRMHPFHCGTCKYRTGTEDELLHHIYEKHPPDLADNDEEPEVPPEVEEWMNSSIQDSMRSGAVVHGKDPDIVGSIEARSLRVPTLSARHLKVLSARQLKQRSLQMMNNPKISKQIVDSTLAQLVMAKGSSKAVRAIRNPRLKWKSSHLKRLKPAADLDPDEALMSKPSVANLSSQIQLNESSQTTKGTFQMNNQNFIPIRPKGQKPVTLKVLKGPNIPGGPQGPAIAKVEGGSGTGPRVVVLQNVKPPDQNVKVELDDDEEFEFEHEAILPDLNLSEAAQEIPGLIRGEVPTLSVDHLRQISRPKGFSNVQQHLQECAMRHDKVRAEIFTAPREGTAEEKKKAIAQLLNEAREKYEKEKKEIKREAELLAEKNPSPEKEPPRQVIPPKQQAKKRAEPYTPKVIITREDGDETVVIIDDGTGEDLEPVSSTEDDEEDGSAEEEVEEVVVAYDTNAIPTGEYEEEEEEDDPDEDDAHLPESTFAASVAETVANVVGASSQQSEEIKAVARAHARIEGIRSAAAGEVNLKMWKNAFHRREYLLEVIENRMCLDCPFMAPNKDALHAHIEVGHNYGKPNRTWGRPPKQ